MFTLEYFTAFANLDYLNLPSVGFIFNVYKMMQHIRNFSKIKLIVAEFRFAFHNTTNENFFRKRFSRNATAFKENIQKTDMIHKNLFQKLQYL